ncbi:MAG: CoB--CoM heterodisulfide reductase iron-sulfur subunit B family protein [Candidatus Freyarchaeota archaeon]|nr:CoB--CoM heterodisulfide reductase iron-sulfur subunit B family protein [Candidatus Jordarchaeia archaeon]
MKYTVFWGCMIATVEYGYEVSVREVFPRLGVELAELGWNACCGYPLMQVNTRVWLYLASRILAETQGSGHPLFVPCNGCHISLCEAQHTLMKHDRLVGWVNELLRDEGLRFNQSSPVRILHTIEVLHDEVGLEKIRSSVVKPFSFKVACHYGCHIIRPADFPRVDDAENPTKMEAILGAIGAKTGDYPERLECCGAGANVVEPELVARLCGWKLKSVRARGFDALVTSCPACQMNYDAKQDAIMQVVKDPDISFPVFYLTQLVGLAMGIEPRKLGLNLNKSPVENLIDL